MATTTPTTKKIAFADVQCGICGQLIRDPRALFCMHTFCAECLLNSVSQDQQMYCQSCGQPTPLFAGIDGLAKDLDMRARIDAYNSQPAPLASPPPPSLDRFSTYGQLPAPQAPASIRPLRYEDKPHPHGTPPTLPRPGHHTDEHQHQHFVKWEDKDHPHGTPKPLPRPQPPPLPSRELPASATPDQPEQSMSASAAALFSSIFSLPSSNQQQSPSTSSSQQQSPSTSSNQQQSPSTSSNQQQSPSTSSSQQQSPSTSSQTSSSSSMSSPSSMGSVASSSTVSQPTLQIANDVNSPPAPAVRPVTANLKTMWKALKGESRYGVNESRTINLQEDGSLDLVTSADQRQAVTGGSDIVGDVATLALSAVGGGLIGGLLGKKGAEIPPALLSSKDKRSEAVDLGAGYAAERLPPEEALQQFMKWIKGQWFLPSDLEEKFSTAEMERLFVPFWVFACRTTTTFSTTALVPSEEFMQSSSPLLAKDAKALEDESVPKEWVRVVGTRQDTYDRIVLVATDEPRLVKYSRDFSSKNWQYQHASKDLAKLPPERQAAMPQVLGWQDLWQRHCNDHLAGFEKKKCKRLLEREGVHRKFVRTKELDCETTYHSFRRRLVYIPIYALDYYYNESLYHAAVHAVTAKVIGDRPWGLGALGKSLKNN